MAIQTKVILRFNGVKVDALGTNWNVVKSVPGGVAFGQDGPIDNYSGVGITYTLSGVTMRIRPTGIAKQGFNPAQRMQAGEEFEATYDEGDPVNGGTTLTLQGCLCREVTFAVNNEAGDIMMQIGRITATRRVPY